MGLLFEILPDLASALEDSLTLSCHQTLAARVRTFLVDRVSYDETVDASYVYLKVPDAPVGVSTMEVETAYWTNIDVSGTGMPVGIEILSPGSLRGELIRLAGFHDP
jgi:uncharacterized protein YuzE